MQHVTKLRIDVQLHPLIAGTYVYQEVIQSVSEKGTVVIFYGKKLKGGGGGREDQALNASLFSTKDSLYHISLKRLSLII